MVQSMDESDRKALEFARHYQSSGETEFMAFSPGEFVKHVVVAGVSLQVTVHNHIVRIQPMTPTNSPRNLNPPPVPDRKSVTV